MHHNSLIQLMVSLALSLLSTLSPQTSHLCHKLVISHLYQQWYHHWFGHCCQNSHRKLHTCAISSSLSCGVQRSLVSLHAPVQEKWPQGFLILTNLVIINDRNKHEKWLQARNHQCFQPSLLKFTKLKNVISYHTFVYRKGKDNLSWTKSLVTWFRGCLSRQGQSKHGEVVVQQSWSKW